MAALDKDTFDVWREGHDKNMGEILLHIRTQHTINLGVEGRLASVESTQSDYDKTVSKRTTWLSAVISAIVGALVSAGAVAYGSGLK